VQKTGVVVENFAQEGWKFSSLRTIGRYGGCEDKATAAAAELPIRYDKPLLLLLL